MAHILKVLEVLKNTAIFLVSTRLIRLCGRNKSFNICRLSTVEMRESCVLMLAIVTLLTGNDHYKSLYVACLCLGMK